MRSYKNLYPRICDFVMLHNAYRGARRLKRYRQEVLAFSWRLEQNLWQLHRQLADGSYPHGAYRQFVVNDSKKRLIRAAPFRDRIVHKAVCLVLEPLFEPNFIHDSYACRKGKGTHKAVRRLESFIKTSGGVEEVYVLKCDVSKFFFSIDHQKLKQILFKHLADKQTCRLLELIIDSHSDSPNRGIPIGNLTSQLFANIYLNELDQFVKHELKERRYIRYMDDFIVVGNDKVQLHKTKTIIEEFLSERLELTLHPRKAIVKPAVCGVDFLGYVIFGTHRRLRSSTVRRFTKRMRRYKSLVEQGVMSHDKLVAATRSWDAYACHGASWRLRQQLYVQLRLPLVCYKL